MSTLQYVVSFGRTVIEKFLPSAGESVLRLQISGSFLVFNYLTGSGMREVQFQEAIPATTWTHVALQVSHVWQLGLAALRNID